MFKLHTKAYREMFRVDQWLKNFLVFLPVAVVPFEISRGDMLAAMGTFFLFCAAASMVYIVNDWVDRQADASHETKKDRPFASGRLGLRDAVIGFLAMITLFVVIAAFAHDTTPYLVALMLVYVSQSFAYSFYAKNIPVLEMLLVSTGYSYRVFAGGLTVGLPPSAFLLFTIFLASIFMVAQKRVADINLLLNQANLRPSLKLYTPEFLNSVTVISGSSALLAFIMFTLSDYAYEQFSNDLLPFTSIFITYAIFRYMFVASTTTKGSNPIKLMSGDKHLIWCGIITLIFVLTTNHY